MLSLVVLRVRLRASVLEQFDCGFVIILLLLSQYLIFGVQMGDVNWKRAGGILPLPDLDDEPLHELRHKLCPTDRTLPPHSSEENTRPLVDDPLRFLRMEDRI